MLALKGKHGTRLRAFCIASILTFGTALIPCSLACSKPVRQDWRPDSMRSGDEWMKMALESPQPDERRRGVVGLAESRDASTDWALKVFDTVARSDTDPSVRCAALRAMEQQADLQSQPTALAILKSRKKPVDDVRQAPASVRWAAARVLYAIAARRSGGDDTSPPSDIVSTLIEVSKSEPDHRVRISVIDTLGYYHDRSVPPALVDLLGDDDFAIRRAAESSLVALTGVTHHYDADAWRSWLAKTSDPFANAGQTPPGWNDTGDKPKWDWLKLPGSS